MRNNRFFANLMILLCLPLSASFSTADQNMRLTSQAGGTWRDVACEGNRLYAQHGLFLTIWDISAPTSPILLGKIRLPGCARFIKVQGDLVYALNASGLFQVVNVGDPANPFVIGSLEMPSGPNAMDTSGTLIYVACDRYLRIIDVVIPATPTLRGRVDMISGTWLKSGVTVSGGYAYVVTSKGLQIVDVRDPDNPVLLGLYSIKYPRGDVAVQEDVAYCFGFGVFHAVDVSDRGDPRLLGSCQVGGGAVVVSGNYAYVGGGGGLAVVDISVPTTPTLCSYEQIEGEGADHIAVSEGTAYVTAEGNYGSYFKAVDVTNPYDPALLWDSGDGTERAYRLAVSRNTAAVIYPLGWSWGDLRYYDVSNPLMPLLKNEVGLGLTPSRICAENERVYITADWDGWTFHLGVFDLGGISWSTSFLGSCSLPSRPAGLAVSQNRVYVSLEYIGLGIFDASVPTTPTLCGSYPASFPGRTGRIVLSNDRAYVLEGPTTETARLLVLDKTTPTSLTLLGIYDVAWDTAYPLKDSDFDVIGNVVYLLESRQTLKVLDFTNPANPVQLGDLNTNGNMIRVSSGLAFILDDEDPYDTSPATLRVVDVNNASAPVLRGSFTVWAGVSDFAAIGKFAYLAAGDAGLLIVRYTGGDSLSAKCWNLY